MLERFDLKGAAPVEFAPVPGVTASNTPFEKLAQRIALVVVLLPLLGFLTALALAWEYGVGVTELGLLLVMYTVGALGLEVGFHRLFSHRSFQTTKLISATLAVAGSWNAQGPVLYWAAIHRRHHPHADRPGDPHSPHFYPNSEPARSRLRGLWHAHVAWLFVHEITDWGRYLPDLLRDRLLFKINQLYFVWLISGLVVPCVAGGILSGTWWGCLNGLLWGGLVRIFLGQQVTWAVNSLCHVYGSRPFELEDRSGNVPWLALPTFGGSWHNNHHAFPHSATLSLRWWQLDLSGLFISALRACGLAWNVNSPKAASHPPRAR